MKADDRCQMSCSFGVSSGAKLDSLFLKTSSVEILLAATISQSVIWKGEAKPSKSYVSSSGDALWWKLVVYHRQVQR